jgi:hypothetical protein
MTRRSQRKAACAVQNNLCMLYDALLISELLLGEKCCARSLRVSLCLARLYMCC